MLQNSTRPTIGFISTWSVYQGATIDSYMYTLLQGIATAARERACNLLLGCGISLAPVRFASHTAFSLAEPNVDFVPVGSWNTDGLIVVPDDLTSLQFDNLKDLIHANFPIVMTTSEFPKLITHNSHLVAVDNASGIRQAMQHLLQHGHRRIAFIAGKSGHGGDVAERLAAYREMLSKAGLAYDSRLLAYGEHRMRDGRIAMQTILDTGANFTALLASNDLSCIGALQALRAAGRRVPDDVAVIGFDDILEARSQLPPLTTVRHPTFALGYQCVVTLLDAVAARVPESEIRIPTQLVVRQSCGCRPESAIGKNVPRQECDAQTLSRAMAEQTVIEARHSSLQDIEPLCVELVSAFNDALQQNDATPFDNAVQHLLQWLELYNEDAYAWHAAISTLQNSVHSPRSSVLSLLIDRARLEISEQAQRQTTDVLLQHMDMSSRLGLMTAQLHAALDRTASAAFESEREILAEHLPLLGITRVLVATYLSRQDDAYACAQILLDTNPLRQESPIGQEFLTREFPPRGMVRDDAPFQWVLLPLTQEERAVGFVALALDENAPLTNLEACAAITHNLGASLRTHRLYREALRGRQLAEEANRLKSRFLSTVSHELRTPLSLIVGLSEMVLQQNEYALSNTAQRDLQQIHTSAQHLGRLINDVLDLASSEAGQLRLQREPLELVHELNAVAQIGAQMAREKNLQWRTNLPNANARIMGDRTRVRQIILNLISNAVKFTARGTIALDARADGDTATIAVSDTGIGILPDEQTKLFREFQRTERSIAAGYGGMGLGLAISKHLVEQHGGTIGVRSPGDLGSGATFYFTLPLLRATQRAPSEDDLLALPIGGDKNFQPFTRELLDNVLAQTAPDVPRTVLVVDDDPGILALHCRLVEQQGHRAIPARNGRDALNILETTRPSLVLLDLMMPELDGFHVLDALRVRETTRDIPVIVLTARALDEADIEKLNRGVTAIMAKGLFRAEETVKQIQTALEHQRTLGNPTQRLVRRAMAFMHAHYAEPLTREQIAAHVNISPDYLTDCFRQETGVTPMVYLNRYRLKQARELLENSDAKITGIALAVGFSESAHFTRMFQREVGVTPRAWRQGKRK